MSLRSRRSGRRGSSLIETALLLPVAVLLCLGGLDFTRLYIAGAQLEAAAAAAASEAARQPEGLEPARLLGLADLPLNEASEVSVGIVCTCSDAPQAWAACEEISCGGGRRRRYARAVAEAGFTTVGRYPGVDSQSRLRREHFVRAE